MKKARGKKHASSCEGGKVPDCEGKKNGLGGGGALLRAKAQKFMSSKGRKNDTLFREEKHNEGTGHLRKGSRHYLRARNQEDDKRQEKRQRIIAITQLQVRFRRNLQFLTGVKEGQRLPGTLRRKRPVGCRK